MKDTSKTEQEEDTGEAFVRVLEGLLDVNYKILEIVDERLSEFEDQVDLMENQKKNGELLTP